MPGLIMPPDEWQLVLGFFIQKGKAILNFCLVSLLLFLSLVELRLLAEAVGNLVLVTCSMLYNHVIAIQTHVSATDIASVHRISL